MNRREFTYAASGVDRELRAKSKKCLSGLEKTYSHSLYGPMLKLPYGNLIPMDKSGGRYQDHKIEGIGNKVLLAQLADKYDTIGIDGVAMVVNDVIRSGAKPFSLTDNIDGEKSDPYLVGEWMKGLIVGAHQAQVPIVGGEIADVYRLIKGIKKNKGHHIVCSCVGYVSNRDIIYGSGLEPGDVIIGLRSSGVHSNGISLLLGVLFREWGGHYKNPFIKLDGFDRELVLETLEPTRIYSREVIRINRKHHLKAAVHVTGDARLKFDKLAEKNKGVGFEFTDLRPQPLFPFIQKTARKLGGYITDKEMVSTYNMGDGLDVVVSSEDEDDVLDEFEKMGVEAWRVGLVNDSGRIVANYNGKKILLK